MHHQGVAARKEDASLSGAANFSEHMSFARINDLTQQIVFADKVSRLHQTSENAGGRGMGVHNVIVAQLLRRNALLHLAGQNTTPNQKRNTALTAISADTTSMRSVSLVKIV